MSKPDQEVVFQYDPQRRRHVEGWNIICLHGEDKIGLTAEEYNDLAYDFLLQGMLPQAEECCRRGIDAGSIRSISLLGMVYQKQNKLEEAYQLYLEAALAGDRGGIRSLSDMYKKGLLVNLDSTRAEKLKKIIEPSLEGTERGEEHHCKV